MSAMDWGRLSYLMLLAAALVFWFFTHNRQSLGKTMQQALAWVFIIVGVIAVVGLWEDIRQTVQPSQGIVTAQGQIEIPRANDGHFYLTLDVNGEPVRFMVDTGATDLVLSPADARRVGIDTDALAYVGRATTANGEVRTAPVKLATVELGPIVDRDIRAWVNRGELDQSLLGMAYLQRWQKIEITARGLVLTR